jgi:hypothetical protein
VAVTPNTSVRIRPELVAAAREGIGDPDAPLMVLVRAGLALLANAADVADDMVRDALASGRVRPGPKPRAGE